jgi:hypothetical protein
VVVCVDLQAPAKPRVLVTLLVVVMSADLEGPVRQVGRDLAAACSRDTDGQTDSEQRRAHASDGAQRAACTTQRAHSSDGLHLTRDDDATNPPAPTGPGPAPGPGPGLSSVSSSGTVSLADIMAGLSAVLPWNFGSHCTASKQISATSTSTASGMTTAGSSSDTLRVFQSFIAPSCASDVCDEGKAATSKSRRGQCATLDRVRIVLEEQYSHLQKRNQQLKRNLDRTRKRQRDA